MERSVLTDRRFVLVASMLATLVVIRIWLHVEPNTDFDVGPYNIHHLFTGVIILTVCGIPAIVGPRDTRAAPWLVAGFGIGLALALDEWVYLIVTDGSNAAYVQSPSLLGGVGLVVLACLYTWKVPPR